MIINENKRIRESTSEVYQVSDESTFLKWVNSQKEIAKTLKNNRVNEFVDPGMMEAFDKAYRVQKEIADANHQQVGNISVPADKMMNIPGSVIGLFGRRLLRELGLIK